MKSRTAPTKEERTRLKKLCNLLQETAVANGYIPSEFSSACLTSYVIINKQNGTPKESLLKQFNFVLELYDED